MATKEELAELLAVATDQTPGQHVHQLDGTLLDDELDEVQYMAQQMAPTPVSIDASADGKTVVVTTFLDQ